MQQGLRSAASPGVIVETACIMLTSQQRIRLWIRPAGQHLSAGCTCLLSHMLPRSFPPGLVTNSLCMSRLITLVVLPTYQYSQLSQCRTAQKEEPWRLLCCLTLCKKESPAAICMLACACEAEACSSCICPTKQGCNNSRILGYNMCAYVLPRKQTE